MDQKIKNRFLLAWCIALVFTACNQSDKKEDTPKTGDSTATAKTEAPPPAAVPDAVKAAPNFYKVLADSIGIRILEVTYNPGDSSAWHSHPDYAIYVAEGGMATFYGKDGAKMEAEMKTGSVKIKTAEFHSVKNTGKTPIKVILVEVSRPGTGVAPDATMDAVKVAGAGLYTTLADTLGIRVLQINYKPGQASKMHSHPDIALYVTDPGKAEFTGKDGKKMVVDMKKGTAMIGGAETHSVKNVGTTNMKAILVEVARPVK